MWPTQCNWHCHDPGTPVALPSSFSISPRAICNRITRTLWPLLQSLTHVHRQPRNTWNPWNHQTRWGSEYSNDPVSRVYKVHLTDLLCDIKDRHVLGVTVAMVDVIEFQKWGLPHCHMLIILREEDKLRDWNDIDRYAYHFYFKSSKSNLHNQAETIVLWLESYAWDKIRGARKWLSQ